MLYRITSRIKRSAFYLLLGIGMSLLWLNQVHAAETVLLQSRDLSASIPLTDLQALAAEQDASPALQQFLQDANQDPAQLKRWLTAKIKPPQVAQQISSDFVLLQINKTVGDPLRRENLEPLRAALQQALRPDNEFSILEIVENYPASPVRIEVNRLAQVYADVNLLVTRIEPVLNVAKQLLPELVCECDRARDAEPTLEPTSSRSVTTASDLNPLKALLPALASASPNAGSAVEPLTALQSSSSPDLANKSLVIQFAPFARSISMRDLTRFAETGELSRGWRSIFNLARVDPEAVRTALNQEVLINVQFLDSALNNLLGEFLLYQVGQVVHTQSDTANIQALRSASILSIADDQRLSLLELLQQYPTRQVYVNGRQLARLGQISTRFQASGGARTAALSVEDWLLELQASAAESLCVCEDESASQSRAAAVPIAPTISAAQIAQFLPADWQPVAAHREDRGIIKLVWLQGTPYEMGYQHGQFLHEEIAALSDKVLPALRLAGKGLALGRLAARRSYPEVVEECRGLAAATQDIGMTLDACLVFAFGDVYQEVFGNTLPNVLFWDGCSQWVASGSATVDGTLYHGSSLDNNEQPLDYIVNNPVVFVRQPTDGLPHVFITYPGVVWPNWGLNVAGISLGLDSAHPNSPDELDLEGGSQVQILGQVLKNATSFAEARQIMETQPRVRANLIMIADGKSNQAGVFEVTGRHLGVRERQENGVLYTTNHFALDEMYDRQPPPNASSLSRFDRFAQLMEPNGISSRYGAIDSAAMAAVGRDRVDPNTMQPSPFDLFDDDASPGGNGALRQGLFDPAHLRFWVAAGRPPVPENPFVCFSLAEMLNFPDATPCASPAL